MPSQRSLAHSCFIAVPVAVIAGLLAFWRTYHVQAWLVDLGLYFDCAYRMSMGQVPYRDFFIVTAPLTYALLGLLMKLFGPFYLVSRIYVAVQCALLVATTYFFCEYTLKLGKARSAALAVFQTIWAPQMMVGVIWYDNDVTFLVLLAGIFLLRAWSQPKGMRWSFLAGISCGLAYWFKQDSGAGAVAGGLAATTLMALQDRLTRRHLFVFVAGVAAVFSATLLYFLAHGAFQDMITWTVRRALQFKGVTGPERTLEQAGSGGGVLGMLLSPFTTTVDHSSKFVLLLYCLAPAAAWYRFRLTRDRREAALAAAALLWAISFYAGLATHAGQGYTNKVATLAVILGILWRPWPSNAPTLLLGRWLAPAFALGVAVIGLRGLRYQKNFIPAGPTVALESPRIAGLRVPESLKPLDALIAYVERNVPTDQDFLIFDQIIVYFAAQRINPHPVTDPNATRVGDEDVILDRLKKRPNIRWYFHLGGREDFSKQLAFGHGRQLQLDKVSAYVKDRFRFLESRDGFSVWVRKDGA
jgi:hypothetical protein